VRLLAALKILEAATLDSKKRNIDTTEVRAALDLFEPICKPEWTVPGFRGQLRPHAEQSPVELEGQQQILRVCFRSIYDCVRELLAARIGKFNYSYKQTNDATVKAELDRLTAEQERLPAQWKFYVR
jgi:hypothetical protein